ncbi:MAG: restriction endonuclease [Burkholderiaceae bacterium]
MKFKMAENSIFAILLRNPWWISFLIAAAFCLLMAALLPKHLVVFGMMGAFPFVITGAVAFKRQWGKPKPAAVEAELTRLSALNWRDFSAELEAKLVKQGFEVTRLNGGAADFKLEKAGHTTLVSAKRYKAATHGLEALQALVTQQEAQGADKVMYVCLSPVTAQAAKFAKEKGVVLGWVC